VGSWQLAKKKSKSSKSSKVQGFKSSRVQEFNRKLAVGSGQIGSWQKAVGN
jgi:hypothetical protein